MINNSVYIFFFKIAQLYTEKNHTELRESARIIVMLTLAVVITVCLFSEDILYFGENI
jgi:hypothetical protein